MKTKDLLKLSPEEKAEAWFEKFLWKKKKLEEIRSPSHLKPEDRHLNVYVDGEGIERCIDCAGFPNILDSLSAWNEYVEKPMGEMGWEFFIHRSFMTKEIAWAGWTRRGEDSRDYESKIQNGQIFLASLDAAFHIPKVLEKINVSRTYC